MNYLSAAATVASRLRHPRELLVTLPEDRAARLAPADASNQRSRAITARIFVGNLSYTTTAEQLTQLLEDVGSVADVYLPSDRATGRPRGFAFVEMGSEAEAEAAIEQLDGKELDGRPLRINAAEERRPRAGGGRPGGYGSPPPHGGRNHDAPPKPIRNKGSRRGLRGKKRSL